MGRALRDPARGAEPFDDNDAAYTEALSAILAGAVSRALHVDSLEQLAFKDPLTGLANRRALDEAATTAFDTFGARAGRRVTVVAVDLNRLKAVNDTHGHAEGDRLITAVAQLLQHRFSRLHGSLVARVGGDEFTVLVPGHPLDQVLSAAQQVCDDASALPIGAGLSCGVASTRASGTSDRPPRVPSRRCGPVRRQARLATRRRGSPPSEEGDPHCGPEAAALQPRPRTPINSATSTTSRLCRMPTWSPRNPTRGGPARNAE